MTNVQPPPHKEERRNFYSRIDEAVSYRPLYPSDRAARPSMRSKRRSSQDLSRPSPSGVMRSSLMAVSITTPQVHGGNFAPHARGLPTAQRPGAG